MPIDDVAMLFVMTRGEGGEGGKGALRRFGVIR